MPKQRLLIEKARVRHDFKQFGKAKEDVDTWRLDSDHDWKEMMIYLEQTFYYRILGSAYLPKCIPNIFKTYGTISQSLWTELMVASGCFSRTQSVKVAERGQAEGCCLACKIPVLEIVPPNTTVGEVAARIRRMVGNEITIHDIMPSLEESSGDGTPVIHSPVAVKKKTEQSQQAIEDRSRPIPAFAHQYRARDESEEIPEIDLNDSFQPELRYVGQAAKPLQGGPAKKQLRDGNKYQRQSAGASSSTTTSRRSNKRLSTDAASSSASMPSYFIESPPTKTTSKPGHVSRTGINKRIQAAERARELIVADPIPPEVRTNVEKMKQLRKERLRKYNAIRMGSLGIDNSFWSEALDSDDDNVALDLTHIKQPAPDADAVKQIDAEIEMLKKTVKSPTAPKKQSDPSIPHASELLANFNNDIEIKSLNDSMDPFYNHDTQQLPGIPSIDEVSDILPAPEKAENRQNVKTSKASDKLKTTHEPVQEAVMNVDDAKDTPEISNGVIEVGSSDDELKDQLKA